MAAAPGGAVMDIVFPGEIQRAANGNGMQKDDDVKIDNLRVRLSAISPDVYEIVLLSESDIFFLYKAKLDRHAYDVIRKEQQLVVNFDAFPVTLRKLLQGCIEQRTSQAALFLLEADIGTLHIVCKMEHKIVELLSLTLTRPSDQLVREAAQLRYQEMRTRLEAAEAKLAEFNSLVRSGKMPSLLAGKHQQHNGQFGANGHHHTHGRPW